MNEQSKAIMNAVQSELCTLSGGMRALAHSMQTVADHEDRNQPIQELEDLGYLVESLGHYIGRLSGDLEEAGAQ